MYCNISPLLEDFVKIYNTASNLFHFGLTIYFALCATLCSWKNDIRKFINGGKCLTYVRPIGSPPACCTTWFSVFKSGMLIQGNYSSLIPYKSNFSDADGIGVVFSIRKPREMVMLRHWIFKNIEASLGRMWNIFAGYQSTRDASVLLILTNS